MFAIKTEEKIDPAKIILEHVADAHDFHFFTIKTEVFFLFAYALSCSATTKVLWLSI